MPEKKATLTVATALVDRWALTPSGPDAPAQSVGRVTRSSRNVGQPDYVLANSITGHKAERRPGASEEWLALTKHHGVKVDLVLINKAQLGQATSKVWSANFNLACKLILQPADHSLDVFCDKGGVGAY